MSNFIPWTYPGRISIGLKRRVTVAAARGRALFGSLSPEWSYLTLAPDNTVVRSYLLTFDNDQVLSKGDSGAWVTDNETHQVYRHVVASDVFGRAHVIPMNDIFADITKRLSLFAIGLASPEEIFSLARFGRFSTPSGSKASDYSSVASDKAFPGSDVLAISADLKEPAGSTQFKVDPESSSAWSAQGSIYLDTDSELRYDPSDPLKSRYAEAYVEESPQNLDFYPIPDKSVAYHAHHPDDDPEMASSPRKFGTDSGYVSKQSSPPQSLEQSSPPPLLNPYPVDPFLSDDPPAGTSP